MAQQPAGLGGLSGETPPSQRAALPQGLPHGPITLTTEPGISPIWLPSPALSSSPAICAENGCGGTGTRSGHPPAPRGSADPRSPASRTAGNSRSEQEEGPSWSSLAAFPMDRAPQPLRPCCLSQSLCCLRAATAMSHRPRPNEVMALPAAPSPGSSRSDRPRRRGLREALKDAIPYRMPRLSWDPPVLLRPSKLYMARVYVNNPQGILECPENWQQCHLLPFDSKCSTNPKDQSRPHRCLRAHSSPGFSSKRTCELFENVDWQSLLQSVPKHR